MNKTVILITVALFIVGVLPANATGVYTCESSPRENWKTQEQLKKKLITQGWDVRKIKEDGGCWEVYAINAKGERVEAYFHPVTLKNVYTSTR